MAFRTKLDFSSNRQVKQRIETFTHLSGGTVFGVPFSSLPTGPDLATTGVTFSSTTLLSTFSGNSATTVYTWYDPGMNTALSSLLPITPTTSATTQDAIGFSPSSYTTIDGNIVATAYSGVSFDIIPISITDLGGGNYVGSVQTDLLEYLSASTLDFTGRTIWNDVSGMTRTQDLIMTRTPIVGAMLECIDSEGKGSWIPASASTSGLWIAGSGLSSVRLNGGGNTASGDNSVAEGTGTLASGPSSHAEGNGAQAIGGYSHAEGNGSVASGFSSHAEGSATTAIGQMSHAEGAATTASGHTSHAEGFHTEANAIYSHAQGYYAVANGYASHSEGESTLSSGQGSHAEGQQTYASGDYSHAEGSTTIANGIYSHAEGHNTIANLYLAFGTYISGTTNNSRIELYDGHGDVTALFPSYENIWIDDTSANNNFRVSYNQTIYSSVYTDFTTYSATVITLLGTFSYPDDVGVVYISNVSTPIISFFPYQLIYPNGHAEGEQTYAVGGYTHTEGYLTVANDSYSHAEGVQTFALGGGSHAEGGATIASGDYSHSEGYGTIADGYYSHAEGQQTYASGWASHAEGDQTQAIAQAAHAEGLQTIASGICSHAEGRGTVASASYSHAEGQQTVASGWASHAGGSGSTASGTTSFVHGANSIAGGAYTIVLGNYITGTTANTTYVERLNVKTVGSTAFANDIRIDANGNLTTNTSDERLKENIISLSGALSTIQALQGVSYQWKDRNAGTDAVRLGFIAQQVNAVDSRLAFTNQVDGYMGIHIDGVIPLLVEAVKELAIGGTSNDYLQTQTILAEDNNIDLNHNGTPTTALGGGITVLHAKGIDSGAELITNENGDWTTNNDFIPNKITIPTYTPSGSTDINGNLGNVTRDEDYLYIRTNSGWRRTNLESF